MSKKRNFVIKLDFFAGFYESYLYDSDTEYYETEETANYYNELCGEDIVSPDDLELDYERYKKDVIKSVVNVYHRYMPSLVESIKFRNMWSPREYNFATDEIYVKAKLSKTWRSEMRAFMKENAEWLRDRIRMDWTSYDGFISFMDNTLDGWYFHIFNEMDERYIGSMITYMMVVEGKRSGDDDLLYTISMDALEDIYMSEYIEFSNKDVEKKYTAAIDEIERKVIKSL